MTSAGIYSDCKCKPVDASAELIHYCLTNSTCSELLLLSHLLRLDR
jgi:hypothetical protein